MPTALFLASIALAQAPDLDAAAAAHAEALDAAEAQYRQAVTAANTAYAAALDEALTAATKAGDLDNAIRLRNRRDQIVILPELDPNDGPIPTSEILGRTWFYVTPTSRTAAAFRFNRPLRGTPRQWTMLHGQLHLPSVNSPFSRISGVYEPVSLPAWKRKTDDGSHAYLIAAPSNPSAAK